LAPGLRGGGGGGGGGTAVGSGSAAGGEARRRACSCDRSTRTLPQYASHTAPGSGANDLATNSTPFCSAYAEAVTVASFRRLPLAMKEMNLRSSGPSASRKRPLRVTFAALVSAAQNLR
jgi:hypothetical protein